MYTSFILIPEFTETPVSSGYGYGASVTEAGLFLLPMTLAMLIVSPIAGWLTDKIGARINLIAGSLVAAASLAVMGLAHGDQVYVYVATGLMGTGIAFAFASLANLIVEAVPPSQTAVATGMNTVMRTLGGAVGAQIGASLIAGTVVAASLPTESGFTLAFLVASGACLLAAVASVMVPRRAGPAFEVAGPVPALAE
jgi:MFS family permease